MKKMIFTAVTSAVFFAALVSFDMPKGWFPAGSKPDKYDMGVDPGSGRTGGKAATIRSNSKHVWGFGTLMQSCAPGKYLGKRVRMTGYMKSAGVNDWAGFWFRVDGNEPGKSLSFDNMSDRAVKGTTDWKKYEIVLDVPSAATNLAYGALISGAGQIWFEGIEFEIVGNSVSKTQIQKELPQNLNFDE